MMDNMVFEKLDAMERELLFLLGKDLNRIGECGTIAEDR